MIGKNLGLLRCDFGFKGMDDIRSVGLIVLGKKYHTDKFEGQTKTETNNVHII